MARRISDRLAEAAKASFVGRDDEFALLRGAIESPERPFVVAFIHGPGGIGKSRLLQALLADLDASFRAVALDCRQIEPTPRGFLGALASTLGIRGPASQQRTIAALADSVRSTVLMLDTFETFGLMDTWLRQVFVPDLPDSVLTVVAGREAPNPAWFTTPGWQELFCEIELRELTDEHALRMLTSQGLTEAQAKRVNRFARGHPLALELAAASVRTQPDLDISAGPPPRVLEQLTRAFLAGLPPDATNAVEAASTVRRLTEPMLAVLLAVPEAREEFDRLRRLAFVEGTTEGLTIHDVVRETVARELSGRVPERYRTYRQRAWRFFRTQSRDPAACGLWQCTADMLYLIENPVVRHAFFPPGASDYTVEPAKASDDEDVRHIARTEDAKQSAELILRWWNRHPEVFSLAKDREGRTAAFYAMFEPETVDRELLSEDPLTWSWYTHLKRNPVGSGERVLFLRRWLARTTGELPSPAQAACWLDIKRTYMALRPHLRRLYTTVRSLETYAPIVVPLGFAPVSELDAALEGSMYYTAVLDFGEDSVDGWLATLVGEELGIATTGTEEGESEGTAIIVFADIAESTLLTEQLGDRAFRARARRLDRFLRKITTEAGGRVVEGKLVGDGVLAVFTSAHRAVECAVHFSAAAQDCDLRLHMGVHAGDVIDEEDNVFGGAVNIAARIAASSGPSEILVSDTVRSLARTSANVVFEDRGSITLKGILEPLHLFAIRVS